MKCYALSSYAISFVPLKDPPWKWLKVRKLSSERLNNLNEEPFMEWEEG